MHRRSFLKVGALQLGLGSLAACAAPDTSAPRIGTASKRIDTSELRVQRLYLRPVSNSVTEQDWSLFSVDRVEDTYSLGRAVLTRPALSQELQVGGVDPGFTAVAEDVTHAGGRRVRILVNGFDFEFRDGTPSAFDTVFASSGRAPCNLGEAGCDEDAIRRTSWISSLNLLAEPTDAVIGLGWFSRGVREDGINEAYAGYNFYRYGPNLDHRYITALTHTPYAAAALSELLRALNAHPSVSRVDVIAHSLGTNVTLLALSKLNSAQIFPSKLRTVVLASGAAPMFYRDAYLARLAQVRGITSLPRIYNVFMPGDFAVIRAAGSANRHFEQYRGTSLDPTPRLSESTGSLLTYVWAPPVKHQGRSSQPAMSSSFLNLLSPPPERYQAIGQPSENSVSNELWHDINLATPSTWHQLTSVAPAVLSMKESVLNHYVVLGVPANAAVVQSLLERTDV